MKLENVSKIYKNKYYDVHALENINLSFDNHGFVFIVGKSGSGKSTLLNMISGVDKPTSGNIFIGDKDITKLNNSMLDTYRNSYISLVFQDYNLITELNAFDNINLIVNDKNKVNKALKMVDLDDLKYRKIHELSGGQKQRLAIARSLAMDSKVILLDEPTAALDSKTGEDIIKVLKKISKDRLVIAVTHDLEIAKKYNDRIIEISDGKIINDTNIIADYENDEVKFTSLPISKKIAIKLSLFNLKNYLSRIIISIILMVIALTLLGLSLNMSLVNTNEAYIKSLYENNIYNSKIERYYTYYEDKQYTNVDNFFSKGVKKKIKQNLDDKIIPIANKYNIPYIYSSEVIIYFNSSINSNEVIKEYSEIMKDRNDLMGVAQNVGCIEYANLSHFGLFLSAGRLPENENEVVISEYLYNLYKLISFMQIDSQIIKVSNYDDVLNKEIKINNVLNFYDYDISFNNGNKKIVGIINSNDKNNQYLKEYLFVSNCCLENYSNLKIRIYNNINNTNFFKEILSYKNDIVENENNYTEEYIFSDNVSDEFYVSSIRIELFRNISLFLSVFLLIITFYLLMDIISLIIFDNIYQYGILTALGIKKIEKYLIYILSVAVVLLISFIMSIITIEVFTPVLNSYICDNLYFTKFFVSNPLTYLIVIIILTIIGFIITVIPLNKLNKYTTAELFKESELK